MKIEPQNKEASNQQAVSQQSPTFDFLSKAFVDAETRNINLELGYNPEHKFSGKYYVRISNPEGEKRGEIFMCAKDDFYTAYTAAREKYADFYTQIENEKKRKLHIESKKEKTMVEDEKVFEAPTPQISQQVSEQVNLDELELPDEQKVIALRLADLL